MEIVYLYINAQLSNAVQKHLLKGLYGNGTVSYGHKDVDTSNDNDEAGEWEEL